MTDEELRAIKSSLYDASAGERYISHVALNHTEADSCVRNLTGTSYVCCEPGCDWEWPPGLRANIDLLNKVGWLT